MLSVVEITREDRGWKGTWYRAGQRWVIWSRELPRPHAEGSLEPFGRYIGSIMRADCRLVPWRPRDLITIARYLWPEIAKRRWRRSLRRSMARNRAAQG